MTRMTLDYNETLKEVALSFSEKEFALVNAQDELPERFDAEAIKDKLLARGFIRVEECTVIMGAEEGLPCSIEWQRLNETPRREIHVPPYYISKYTVTNEEYEKFDKRHSRTHTSSGDRNPVTCLTYGKAIGYALWLNEQTGLAFSLPTEPQYVAAATPIGWQYTTHESGHPYRKTQNHFRAFPEKYPDGELGATLPVDDPTVEPNHLGIHHATGNVSIFSLGHYPTPGHWGSTSDGSYVIVLGGNFRLCPLGTRSITRGVQDVTGIADTVGIRLVHPDPEYLLKSKS